MTNLEKLVRREIKEVVVSPDTVARVMKYGKHSPQRIDFDILSPDGSYQFNIYIRANLLGLTFTARYINQWYSCKPNDHQYSGNHIEYYLCGPKVSPKRKKEIKLSLQRALLTEVVDEPS